MHWELNASSSVNALVEVLVQEPCSHQRWIIGGHIAEIGVAYVECDARMNLHSEREKALSQPGANRWRTRIGRGFVELHGVVQREKPLVRKLIFSKHERPVDAPVDHIDAAAAAGGIVEAIVVATMHIQE